MRAVRYHRFGGPDVFQVEDVPQPEPGPGAVRVRVAAAALNPKDSFVRMGKIWFLSGVRFPRGVGHDFAGEIDAVGPGVEAGLQGQGVFGMTNGFWGATCAEAVIVPVGELAPRPTTCSVEEAAAVPLVGLTALQALRDDARVRSGQRVLLHGASGGVGVHAIQIAKALGLTVSTTSSAANLDLCRSLGADESLDYRTRPWALGEPRFHCVFDIFGNLGLREVLPALLPGGTYVTAVPGPHNVPDWFRAQWTGRHARVVMVRSRAEDLRVLASWIEQGALRPVVDRHFPLEGVGDAQRYIETKRARGKVVIRVA